MSDPSTARPFELRPLCVRDGLVAHTPGRNGVWHQLADHSRIVGDLAAEFAEPFGGQELARLCGYVHDAGKATDAVQRRFHELGFADPPKKEPLGVKHKIEGAQLASSLLARSQPQAAFAAYLALYGHHGGIPDVGSPDHFTGHFGKAVRYADALAPLVELMGSLVGSDLRVVAARHTMPPWVSAGRAVSDLTGLDLYTRMCHSALVDADFLDTAAHFGGHEAPWRAPTYGIGRLRDVFMSRYASRFSGESAREIDIVRRQVFDASVAAATVRREAGIYRLPAPTGTGKTLSAAAFALNHAARFGKRRVIVAVPFTTITTQNAAVYRDAFGDLSDAVLEHHSSIVDEDVAEDTWRRLSATQWDGEFVVTTTVQLFESLFSNRPSRTRKLHRIVDSVVVLDEVQALPIDLLPPILRVLRELTEHYGVTVLLASATQPSFWDLRVWDDLPAYDIIPVGEIPEVTQRVSFTVRREPQTWESLCDELAQESQALFVVNTRGDADRVYELARERVADPTDVYLLTRSLTSDHRERVLSDVRHRLRDGERVTLVSTQLIEAGVDLDFPMAFRALGPADSVVQVAGRANRNGDLGVRQGRVVVVQPEGGGTPGGVYRELTEQTRSLFVDQAERYRFDDPGSLDAYYLEVYARRSQIEQQARMFAALRAKGDFPGTAREFQMIPDDSSVDAVVTEHPDPEVASRIAATLETLRAEPLFPLDRHARRLLSRHSASASRKDIASGMAEELAQGVHVWLGPYDPRRGIVTSEGLVW